MASIMNGTIALLGEALVDVFPDNPVIGGAPFNVARNLAALGSTPVLVTRIGNDAYGAKILDDFTYFGVSIAGLQFDDKRPTGSVKVTMDGHQHQFHILENQAWDYIDADLAEAAIFSADPRLIYFGTLAQRSKASREAILRCLRHGKATRFLDLNLRGCENEQAITLESLKLADQLKVNDQELKQLIDWFVFNYSYAGDTPIQLGHPAITDLMQQFDIARLFVTLGPDGYVVFDQDGNPVTSGVGCATTLVDTVGAGDAFVSIILLGETLEWPIDLTLARANAFAASVCGLRGAVTRDEKFYGAWRERWDL
jgi:fructokinase